MSDEEAQLEGGDNGAAVSDGQLSSQSQIQQSATLGNQMTVVTEEIGDNFAGGYKWGGGALAADGCIYCAPFEHDRILKIDPKTDTTSLVGKGFGRAGGYCGLVASKDGQFVYFTPGNGKVLKYDIRSKEWTKIGETLDGGWKNPVLAADGCIYAAPLLGTTKILKIDSSDIDSSNYDKIDLIQTPSLPTDWHYSSSVLSGDKKQIYFIPNGAKQILRFNVETQLSDLVGDEYTYDRKWIGGAFADDGCMYAMPDNFNRILKYDPESESTELVGDDLGDGGKKWAGCFKGRDGCIYGIPCVKDQLLRFDPTNARCTLVGKKYEGSYKWDQCVEADNGSIYAIPHYHKKVLKITLMEQASLAATVRGINDTIDTVDLLGYGLYAKVLARQAESLQDRNEPLCVGLLAPWGAGKSFIWNLIRKELEGNPPETTEVEPAVAENKSTWGCCRRTKREQWGKQKEEISLSDIVRNTWFKIIWAIDKISAWKYCCFDCPCFRFFLLVLGIVIPIWLVLWLSLIIYSLKARACGKGVFSEVSKAEERTLIWKRFKGENVKGHTQNDDEEQQRDDNEKRSDVFVEFGAWSHDGTVSKDSMWAAFLQQIWTEVECKFGIGDVRLHRAGCKKVEEEKGFVVDPAKRAKEQKPRSEEQKNATDDMRWRIQSWYCLYICALVSFVVLLVFNTAWAFASYTGSSGPSPALSWILGILVPLVSGSIGKMKISNEQSYAITGYESIKKQISAPTSKISLSSFARKDFSREQGFMGEIKKEVAFLIDYLQFKNARLVVCVDDMDRCDQDKTMQILWTVKLLLAEGPISCWLAIDSKIVVDFIEADFGDVDISGYQYLEKIINLPFSIPVMDEKSKRKFLKGVLDAPELTLDQVYNKLSYAKINQSDLKMDEKWKELISFATSKDMFNGDVPSKEILEKDEGTRRDFFSHLLEVANTSSVTAYENFYGLMEEELWIGNALKGSDNGEAPALMSPKGDEGLETVRDKIELETELRKFLQTVKIGAKIDHAINTEFHGWEFAMMANKVFERMKACVPEKNVNNCKESEREKLFKDNFMGVVESSQKDIEQKQSENDNDSSQGERPPSASQRPTSNRSHSAISTSVTDMQSRSYLYKNLKMVDDEERGLMLKYAPFLSDVPRKIKRVVNVYAVSREIAWGEKIFDDCTAYQGRLIREKLFILILLQESFPYRSSWLVFMAMCVETKHFIYGYDGKRKQALFRGFLDKISKELEKDNTGSLLLSQVYDQITSGMLHCLPNSVKLLRADANNTDHFEMLVHRLKLSDLFCDGGGLQKYLFNLPRSMVGYVKNCCDHCIPKMEGNKVTFTRLEFGGK